GARLGDRLEPGQHSDRIKLAQQRLLHLALPLHAREVTGGGPRAHVVQRVLAVQALDTRLEPALDADDLAILDPAALIDALLDLNLDAAQRIDEVTIASHIDHNRVLHRDAEYP